MIPRSRNNSQSSTVSVKEDEEESSDEADKKSSQSPAQKEKPGDGKENTRVEGFVLWPLSPSQMVWAAALGAWALAGPLTPHHNAGVGLFPSQRETHIRRP